MQVHRGRRCRSIVVSVPRRGVTWANCSVPATCAEPTMSRVQAQSSVAQSSVAVRARKPFGEAAARSNCARSPCWQPAGYLSGVDPVRQLAMAKDRCPSSRSGKDGSHRQSPSRQKTVRRDVSAVCGRAAELESSVPQLTEVRTRRERRSHDGVHARDSLSVKTIRDRSPSLVPSPGTRSRQGGPRPFYHCRHTYISTLLAAGAKPLFVCRQTGQASR